MTALQCHSNNNNNHHSNNNNNKEKPVVIHPVLYVAWVYYTQPVLGVRPGLIHPEGGGGVQPSNPATRATKQPRQETHLQRCSQGL